MFPFRVVPGIYIIHHFDIFGFRFRFCGSLLFVAVIFIFVVPPDFFVLVSVVLFCHCFFSSVFEKAAAI